MQLVTYLAGRTPRLGAVWHGAVLDLRNLSVDLATQRAARPPAGAVLPRTMLELIDGGPDVWSRQNRVLSPDPNEEPVRDASSRRDRGGTRRGGPGAGPRPAGGAVPSRPE